MNDYSDVPTQAKQPKKLEVFEDRILAVSERVHSARAIIEEISDGLNGSEPSPTGEEKIQGLGGPDTLFGKIERSLNALEAATTALEIETQRIKGLL